MDIKFSKDAGNTPQQGTGGEKGKQNILLVVLLVLVAALGYVYFFTGLIKPAAEQKVAEAPATVQVVKKPLPSPDGVPAKSVAKADDAKEVAAAPAKPEPAKAAPSAPAPAPKPSAAEVAKPKVEPKKVEAPQPAVKKPVPVAAKAGDKPAASDKKQPAAAEKKPVVADKKPVVAEKKPVAVEKKAAEAQKPVKKESAVASALAPAGEWTVLVGNYVLEEALAADLARVRKAGVSAYIVPGSQKKTHMNRLLLAEFTDRASAQIELDKLKRSTSDAFMIDSAGMHVVYAGSYLLDARAQSEKERLTAAGFSLTLKRADVAIPTKNLTAGSFADKKVAEDTLKKLRAAGVKATLSR